jgi:Tfp pilus assembly protein PilF/opacity protein-like surface antigen
MRVSIVAIVTLTVNWVCAAGVQAQATAASASAAMQAGISEFRAGEFTHALTDFLEAQRRGLDTPVLHYNLGATYYKLGRDPEAAAEFRSLASDPKFGDFARYNLGLIARRSGRKSEAHEYFATVASGARNPHLRDLARAELHERPATRHRQSWRGLFEVNGGYDDNVVLSSRSTLVAPSGGGSSALTALAGGAGQLTGNSSRGLRLVGTLYDAQYPSQSAFDLLIARAGPEYRFPLASWRIQTGGYVTHIRLGSNELETLGVLNLRGEHALGSGRVRLDYSLERIGGGALYGYLTGWQSQYAVRTSWSPGPFLLTCGYSLTLNSRRDLASGTQFFSVSPLRNQLDAGLNWNTTLRTALYARGSYWHSRYADPNVFLQAGALVTQRRVDNGLDAELGLLYRLSSNARINAEYRYRRNDSNIDRYAYTSNRYMLGLQYGF